MELTWVDPLRLCSELISESIFKTMVDAKLIWRGFDRMARHG
jgi:hypothetical protein